MYIAPDGPNPLTPTEERVVRLVMAGYTRYDEIAEQMTYTMKGAEKVLQNIRYKTGARNMADIVIWGHARLGGV